MARTPNALLVLVLAACAAETLPPHREPPATIIAAAAVPASMPAATPAVEPAAGAGNCVARAPSGLPQQLSQLGCFDAADPRWPAPTTIAFDVNAPLWSDGADKERFIALPAGATIALDARGDFVLPPGTLLAKTFSLGGARIETRVLMHDAAQGWHGASYRWRDDGSDADLAPEAGMALPAAGPLGQPWTIPARGQCFSCHNDETHVALGLEVAQLDRAFVDPHTGQAGNQLDRLVARGVIDGAHPAVAGRAARPRLADYRDSAQPLADRARAYLHANCSSCHARAEGFCTGDLRFDTLGAAMGACNVPPKGLDPSWPQGTQLLAPGDPERSAIVHRLRAPGGSPLAMPPIGRHAVDEAGVALISAWIAAQTACE